MKHDSARERYAFRIGARTVKIDVGSDCITARWAGQSTEQRLSTSSRWAPTRRRNNEGLPGVILWQPERGVQVLIAVLRDTESGNWSYRGLSLFVLRQDRWEKTPHRPRDLDFSNLGGFCTDANELRIWDIDYDSNYAHMAPQRYKLRRYRWAGSLKRPRVTLTKGRHHVFGLAYFDRRSRSPADDPLREFGLRWRWWGDFS